MSKPTMHLKNEDERTKQGGSMDVRGDRGNEDDDDRSDSVLASDDEFEKFLNDEFSQTALPTAPKIPGYHVCWLTTASQYDSVFKRQRLGYALVRQSEMKGFDASNGQVLTGYEGFVTCNEMVLAKIPEGRYQKIMKFFHHDKPLQEEGGIVDKMNAQGERLDDPDEAVAAMEREIAAKKNAVPIFA